MRHSAPGDIVDAAITVTPQVGRNPSQFRALGLHRALLAPIILLGVTLVVFIVVDLSPNDPATAELGVMADDEARQRFIDEHGLDEPLLVRFGHFLVNLVHLELGESVTRPESVNELIARALPVSLQLMTTAVFMSVVFSLALGILAAWKEGKTIDQVISAVIAILQASPSFWIGLLFVQLFAVSLGLLPASGYTPLSSGIQSWYGSMIGPAIVLAIPITAALTRVLRASIADELAKDYVRTAIGNGVGWVMVLSRNVLRNALIAPVTVLGLVIGDLIAGAILVEVVFNLPGMGTLLVAGVNQGDLGVVRGVALVGAIGFIAVNLLVDLIYLVLNPRSVNGVSK
ncbi:ABC transporter permease [Jiangella aurantiaca]|nr:ABC transporter permease [Jiangella aurantiaca]